MKKLGLLVMPLMAVSLLASCGGGGDDPGPTPVSVTHEVSFNFNGGAKGTDAVESIDKITDKTLFYNITDFTKQIAIPSDPAHFDFIGWGLTDDTQTKISDTYKVTDDVEVFAIYKPKATAKVTFDGSSTNCKLYLENETECVMGYPVIIPAGINVKLTVEANDGYLPIFDDNLTVTNATSSSFDPLKQEITINVTTDVNCLVKATTSETKDELKDYSWSEINEISEGGVAPLVFKVGDEKTVILKENGTDQSFAHTVRIIDFNHDKDSEENDLGITFEFANVITNSNGNAVTKEWNKEQDTSSTNYDYRASTLNNFLNNDVLNMLPTDPVNKDLKEVIKPVDKKVGVNESKTEGSQYYTATSFDGNTHPYPYLFPLAHDEIADNESGVVGDEGSKHQYYIEHQNQTDRIKRKAGETTGNGEHYWLRSPRTDDSYYAWCVGIDGCLYFDYDVYGSAFAVAPAFCI